MAFTPEDGTGLEDANALTDVEFADAYFAERGVTAWTGSDTVKQQKIVDATDYVLKTNKGKWRGTMQYPGVQALDFPRTGTDSDGVDLDDTVPVCLQQAVCEYAVRALSSTLLPDPSDGPDVIRKRTKVGPIEEETEFSGGATQIKPYPAADALLKGILRARGGRAIRA